MTNTCKGDFYHSEERSRRVILSMFVYVLVAPAMRGVDQVRRIYCVDPRRHWELFIYLERRQSENLSMRYGVLLLLAASSLAAHSQAWSSFLDPSRAIDWSDVGFPIPDYTTECPTQPSLRPDDLAAAPANSTAIQLALASCDATHNVVSIPAGTYYVAGWTYGFQGNQVVRGQGPMSTIIYLTALVECHGLASTICMVSADASWGGAPEVLPPSGSRQCLWTNGYARGTTTITLSHCGGIPPIGTTLVLDQANDIRDTRGIYICDSNIADCSVEPSGNRNGRTVGTVTYSQKQIVYVTGRKSLGKGSNSLTISPGIYFKEPLKITELSRVRLLFPSFYTRSAGFAAI